ncbi:thiolase-like protein [Dactylonectria estremocensis]|uniref:Thiolase-like protein n=1 Tax=Dactylonectria estremocensis TaxID=1079267 RepID=A0A9P9DZH6_9HYPO|nr:thiolase-like protein [Dactylonectria estremocensis]
MAEPIAVIGTACRFPGSTTSPSKLWELLKAPRDVSYGEVHGCTDVQQRSYLLQEDIHLFDAPFFRINPKEAAGVDSWQKIFLETLLASMEGSQISVHFGIMTNDCLTIQSRDPDRMGSHAATGLSRSILANRVSYVFDLKGTSMSGLRNGEAAQAVVAGTSLLPNPHWFILQSSLHMLSPDAQSRIGEGCAAVDGDDIECIIRETGINSDGRIQGLTMPSHTPQVALIRQTYKTAGLDPVTDRCHYFECHGTGTRAGDTIEAGKIQLCSSINSIRSEVTLPDL